MKDWLFKMLPGNVSFCRGLQSPHQRTCVLLTGRATSLSGIGFFSSICPFTLVWILSSTFGLQLLPSSLAGVVAIVLTCVLLYSMQLKHYCSWAAHCVQPATAYMGKHIVVGEQDCTHQLMLKNLLIMMAWCCSRNRIEYAQSNARIIAASLTHHKAGKAGQVSALAFNNIRGVVKTDQSASICIPTTLSIWFKIAQAKRVN